jgi:hypothetical protein
MIVRSAGFSTQSSEVYLIWDGRAETKTPADGAGATRLLDATQRYLQLKHLLADYAKLRTIGG